MKGATHEGQAGAARGQTEHLHVRETMTREQIRALARQTDIHALAEALDELAKQPEPDRRG